MLVFYYLEYDYSKCEDEYFSIDNKQGLDIWIYKKDKKDILDVVKEYRTKKFFI